jgi:hypothetical protein
VVGNGRIVFLKLLSQKSGRYDHIDFVVNAVVVYLLDISIVFVVVEQKSSFFTIHTVSFQRHFA